MLVRAPNRTLRCDCEEGLSSTVHGAMSTPQFDYAKGGVESMDVVYELSGFDVVLQAAAVSA